MDATEELEWTLLLSPWLCSWHWHYSYWSRLYSLRREESLPHLAPLIFSWNVYSVSSSQWGNRKRAVEPSLSSFTVLVGWCDHSTRCLARSWSEYAHCTYYILQSCGLPGFIRLQRSNCKFDTRHWHIEVVGLEPHSCLMQRMQTWRG